MEEKRKVNIFLGKYSDWLEAYSIFNYFNGIYKVRIYFVEDDRNNIKAVSSLFSEYKQFAEFSYYPLNKIDDYICRDSIKDLVEGDVFAAPFVRLRKPFCPLLKELRKKGVISVHLSESIPDSFGIIGYRYGFRMRSNHVILDIMKQTIILPYFVLYSLTHKPDYCFYEMEPNVHNKFVKKSISAFVPKIDGQKKELLKHYLNGEKRPLLIGGFGFDVYKMASFYHLNKYIATSKNKEIIIDGRVIPLDYYICAEEVMLAGCVDRIIGYNSTAMCWAAKIGNIEIECYKSSQQSKIAGAFFGYFSSKTLAKCGINMKKEKKELLLDSKSLNINYTIINS